ncbi:MAG: putative ABC transporter permease [Eubacterium sp.]
MNNKVNEKNKSIDELSFNKLVWIFLISCITGYIVEEIWCFIKLGYFESRQSLIYGPLSVVYGMGAVVLTLSLYKIRNSKLHIIFLISFLVGTVTEYIASLGQEIIFGSVAWDYSNVPLNINGRVCLLYSLFWGVLGIAWIKLCYPLLCKVIEKCPHKMSLVITRVFIIFFIFDCIISASAALRMDQRNAGIPAQNTVDEFLDKHYTDERMHEIYANSKDV